MATNYLGVNRGVYQPGLISVGTSAPSTDFFLGMSTTHTPTKEDVILALRIFEQYILSGGLVAGETGVDLPTP